MTDDLMESVWDLSATEDSSPVSELSFSLQNLQCQDGVSEKSPSPRRKLVLTPEWISPQTNTLSRERETPTVSAVKRRRARSLSPKSSSNKKVQSRRLWGDLQDSAANKENERAIKRLRVQLSSRFSSASEEPESACRSGKRYCSDPEDDASCTRETDAVDAMAAARLCRMRSHRNAPPTQITEAAVADLTLIGDFTKEHLLPVESVGHHELHCVSVHTVASLIRGEFGPAVKDFLIIDCRYPYEYQGGHIKGAINLYTESQIQQAVFQALEKTELCPDRRVSSWGRHEQWPSWQSDSLPEKSAAKEEGSSSPRKLIVFHCEFSSKRGPHLCQYLRRLDRSLNVYPNLHYPELYLLLGGYKHFHSCYPDICEPCGYVPMRQREYQEQLHGFRRRRPARQRRRRPVRIHQRTTR
ncbi:cell division cycle 25 homolog d isoform X2 [Triplophysa rosa]|uniref:protein-tyrosine-phosphatase n=1 Tax=Triplophysa rosa TaxID=992332 RepID=A0A9W7T2S3_TRIRA|nr:cell division cycle 25 homolog d isoform X2 [Triplophysa rosa]KAI7790480.1 cell division cycle 25-like protein d [Triplophysa rosa]